MTRAIVARAPTRIDFGGGWTDVPPYTEHEGGAVCSVAITRYATATAALDEQAARRAGVPAPADDALTAAALRRAGIPVSGHIPLLAPVNAHNTGYLATKREKSGHLL